MVAKFWETVAGELAKKWASLAAGAAAAFWAAGIAAWALGHEKGLKRINDYASDLDTLAQVVLVAGVVAVVVSSSHVLGLVQPGVLRVLQGDIPLGGTWSSWKRGRVAVRRRDGRKELAELQAKGLAHLSATDSRRAARIDAKLHRLPVRAPDERLTALGNLMSASEARPLVRYGLNPGVVWPALWLVLPELTRTELQAARSGLDSAIRSVMWGALLAVWTVWTPWALAVAVPVTAAAYVTLVRRADAFGHLSEATFAVHRFELYAKLGFPAPTTPEEDRIVGEQVTEYLWRGTVPLGLHWHSTPSAVPSAPSDAVAPAAISVAPPAPGGEAGAPPAPPASDELDTG